ncbi:MAG: DUF402 domain-containing protein [Nocardioides sp.]
MPDPKPYEPGSVVRRRVVLHGRLWLDHPVTVVADDGDLLAVRLEPGSAFTSHSHPFGEHPWAGHDAWSGPVVLQLYRAGDPYSVWRFHEPDGAFRHWYVTFQTPVVRRKGGFDIDDHGLDLVIEPDGTAVWKDVERLHELRQSGQLNGNQLLGVLAAAHEVTELLRTDRRWWSAYDDWSP